MKGFAVAATVLSIGALVACMRPAAVWVAPGSTRDHLGFLVGEERGGTRPVDNFQMVRVGDCPASRTGRIRWEATGSARGESPDEQAFWYGRPPAGLVTRVGPEALGPGCYVVEISGEGVAASSCFRIGPDGAVVALAGGTLPCEDHGAAA